MSLCILYVVRIRNRVPFRKLNPWSHGYHWIESSNNWSLSRLLASFCPQLYLLRMIVDRGINSYEDKISEDYNILYHAYLNTKVRHICDYVSQHQQFSTNTFIIFKLTQLRTQSSILQRASKHLEITSHIWIHRRCRWKTLICFRLALGFLSRPSLRRFSWL
jgi:hypothetical protein